MESGLLGPAGSLKQCEWWSLQQRGQERSLLQLKQAHLPQLPPGNAETQCSALSKYMSSFLSDPDLPLQSLMLAKQEKEERLDRGKWAQRALHREDCGPSSGSQEQESWIGRGPRPETGQ